MFRLVSVFFFFWRYHKGCWEPGDGGRLVETKPQTKERKIKIKIKIDGPNQRLPPKSHRGPRPHDLARLKGRWQPPQPWLSPKGHYLLSIKTSTNPFSRSATKWRGRGDGTGSSSSHPLLILPRRSKPARYRCRSGLIAPRHGLTAALPTLHPRSRRRASPSHPIPLCVCARLF